MLTTIPRALHRFALETVAGPGELRSLGGRVIGAGVAGVTAARLRRAVPS